MRRQGYIGITLVSLMFIIGVTSLYRNLSPHLFKAERDLAEGKTMLISRDLDAGALGQLLYDSDYINDRRDADAAAQWIASRAATLEEIPNLGTLNLSSMKIPVGEAAKHQSPLLDSRIAAENERLGITSDVITLYDRKDIPSDITVGNGDAKVSVKVYESSDSTPAISRLLGKLSGNGRKPAKGVIIRANEHFLTSYGDNIADPSRETSADDSIVGYAMTDASGKATFHLPAGRYYSFLPVQPGYQFGQARGTSDGHPLEHSATYSFVRSTHKITPLDTSAYSRLKDDEALIVRTPGEFRSSLLISAAIFIIAWWLFFIFTDLRDRRLGTRSDCLIPVILATLTGIGLLAMFAITNPLTDRLLGYDTAIGILFGLIGMTIFSGIDLVKFRNGQSRAQSALRSAKEHKKWWAFNLRFDFFSQLLGRICRLLYLDRLTAPVGRFLRGHGIVRPEGIGYALMAVILMILLALLGTGPEGSDAKVNLSLGITFQPSEVCKYLIVIFFAAFFAENAPLIQAFSQRLNSYSWKRHATISLTILTALLLLCAIYLKLLSDMGPALVVTATFIILYSVARKDLPQLIGGVVSFLAVIWVADHYFGSTAITAGAAAAWTVAWILIWGLGKRRIYESAVFLNVVIAAFMFGSSILGGSEGARLANRTALSGAGIWDNTVEGGDQIAQGIWSLSTGGFSGQGLGNGNPNVVPAFHTDMIFTSIGEVMGWCALLMLLVCFGVLIHRSLLVGRRAGHPFAFFLISGIALVTGLQFLIIVAGSIGLIPLTGIAVPFLSFGKSSLIINMAFFGLLLSLSRRRATSNQAAHIKSYDNVIVAGSATFLSLALLLAAVLFHYQCIDRDSYIVKPVLTANRSGARIVEYNPRIALLMNRLDAGNIYDRNGVLLATSSVDELSKAYSDLENAGVTRNELDIEKAKRHRRYYPFGDRLLFMLGDYNSRILWDYSESNPPGYLAENRHLSQLRGFDNLRDSAGQPTGSFLLSTDNYRASRFLPPMKAVSTFTRRDYSDPRILEMLKHGNDTNLINQWNAARPARDLTLTVDARLQNAMIGSIADGIAADPRLANNENLRVSVVILDAEKGDLLTSANYPLPDSDTIKMLNDNRITVPTSYYEKRPGHSAITERDLGLTYQTMPGSTAKVMSAITGFMAFGPDAADLGYKIYRNETVEPGTSEPSVVNISKNRNFGTTTYVDDAIVYSSNAYFVKLIHENHLYDTLATLYSLVGAGVDNPDGSGQATPYTLTMTPPPPRFHEFMERKKELGQSEYARFYAREHDHSKWQRNYTDRLAHFNMALPWGQGGLRATPLALARVVSIVANEGNLVPTRFILSYGGKEVASADPIRVIDPESSEFLKKAMQRESDRHRRRYPLPVASDPQKRIGGKTGTPERGVPNTIKSRYGNINDAWYVCFVHSETTGTPLAIAMRIERIGEGSGLQSGRAVDFVAKRIIPALNEAGYRIE